METSVTDKSHIPSSKPLVQHHTKQAQHPYQGVSKDFSFSRIHSSDSDCQENFEGINGETAWILITDHFTGIFKNNQISKAAPVQWLEHFIAQYNPLCRDNKYVFVDQWSGLFNNPEVVTKLGYTIHPTHANASNQNGPAKCGHQPIANMMQAILTGSNLDIKF